jgi:hypothetical protein
MIAFLLNSPYTLLGIIVALSCFPYSVSFQTNPIALLFKVHKCWWGVGPYKYMRAATIGHVILLTDKTLKNDFEHEIIHIRQQEKYPLIFWFLYFWETLRKGYRQNRFEEEAYTKSKSYYGKNPPAH